MSSTAWPAIVYENQDDDSEGVPSVHSMSEDEDDLSTSVKKIMRRRRPPVKEMVFDPEPYEPEHITGIFPMHTS